MKEYNFFMVTSMESVPEEDHHFCVCLSANLFAFTHPHP